MQESASFWTDIKNLEEQYAKSPDSLCFARLAEVYLKVGLVDDAVHVARQGGLKHPRYLSGQRALALACHAKGLAAETIAALKVVTEALPEDVSSQKLLGRLLAEVGDLDSACQAFRTALEFVPDDVECRIELESLERATGKPVAVFEVDQEDDEEIIEDLEIIEEPYFEERDQPVAGLYLGGIPPDADGSAASQHDPLSTGTLAELYVTQGFIHKALEIYRAILVDNPADQAVAERVAALEKLEAGSSEPDFGIDYTMEEEAVDEPDSNMTAETFLQNSGSDGVVNNALSTLDRWLDSIRRIKLCR
ncbi:MAG: tetratricopeptide repeat protein [Desulfuromonadaceae bacterium]